jgi:hypothetical protein
LIFISARVVPKKISLETIVTCLNEPRRSRLRGSQDREERSKLQGISPGEIEQRNVFTLAIHFIGLTNKRSSFLGPRTKQASIRRKNSLKVACLHATTKMSPPYDLEVAFLAKQDMGMNPRLQDRKDYAAL